MEGKGTLSVSTNLENGSVKVTIQDTGCGIREADLPHVFDAFFSTKDQGEGMGIGLYFVKKIVDDHKGKIWAESPGLDKGSAFFVELPTSI